MKTGLFLDQTSKLVPAIPPAMDTLEGPISKRRRTDDPLVQRPGGEASGSSSTKQGPTATTAKGAAVKTTRKDGPALSADDTDDDIRNLEHAMLEGQVVVCECCCTDIPLNRAVFCSGKTEHVSSSQTS